MIDVVVADHARLIGKRDTHNAELGRSGQMSTVTAIPSTSAYASANTSFKTVSKPGLSCMLVAAVDIVGVSVALWAFYGHSIMGRYVAQEDWLLLWPLVPLFLILYWCFDLYPGVSISPVDEIRRICLATTGGFASISGILALLQGDVKPQVICLPASICASVLVLAMRTGIRRIASRLSWWGYPVAVFGCGDVARSMLHRLKSQPHLGLRPVVVVTDRFVGRELDGFPVFKLEHLTWISSAGVRHAIVAAPELSHSEFSSVMERGCNVFPHLILIPDNDSMWRVGSYTEDVTGILGLQLGNNLLQNGPRVVKRMMDVGLSIVLTILLFPLLTVISLLVVLDSGFPVLYSQERVGREGKYFRIWKFRTMAGNSAEILIHCLATNPEARREWYESQKLRNDPRITRVGRVLRKLSLDEFPQLWNVIRGEMSLVGPRPIVDAEVAKYRQGFAVYSKTTPGITGLWQVSGRNHTTYEERVAFDTFYVRNWSVWLDIYLLAKTVAVVLTGHGAY